MRMEMSEGIVHVFLSEKNLKILLAKLRGFPADSENTIVYQTKDGPMLYVSAEPDDVHYANPERDINSAGPMHPDSEAAIR